MLGWDWEFCGLCWDISEESCSKKDLRNYTQSLQMGSDSGNTHAFPNMRCVKGKREWGENRWGFEMRSEIICFSPSWLPYQRLARPAVASHTWWRIREIQLTQSEKSHGLGRGTSCPKKTIDGLNGFEPVVKIRVLYVAMAEKPLLSGFWGEHMKMSIYSSSLHRKLCNSNVTAIQLRDDFRLVSRSCCLLMFWTRCCS